MNSFFGGFPDPMTGSNGMMMPFGGGMFGNFGSMMNNMNNSMSMMASGNHPGQSFSSSSSSTFMSYSSNGPNGQPQVLHYYTIRKRYFVNLVLYKIFSRYIKLPLLHVLVQEE